MNDSLTQQTREVAEKWYNSLDSGDFDTAISCLAEDVIWRNIDPTQELSDIIPWIGTYHGVKEVLGSFDVWTKASRLLLENLITLVVQDEIAIGIYHERAQCLANNNIYEILVANQLKIQNGKIVEWQAYWDPSPLIAAYKDIQVKG